MCCEPKHLRYCKRSKKIGIERIVMVTGDNGRVASAVARQAGIDEFHAELLPEDKVRVLKSLKAIGPIAMIGDGVNDAPSRQRPSALRRVQPALMSQWKRRMSY